MTKAFVITILFWLSLLLFLAVSVGPMAWLYYAYGPADGLLGWALSYFVAIGIDVLVCWLAYASSKGTTGIDTVMSRVLIGVVALFCCYADYLSALAHHPASHTSIWSLRLVGTTTAGEITPLLLAAVPLLLMGYICMLGKLGPGRLQTLEEQANYLEHEQMLRGRIAQAKQRHPDTPVEGRQTDLVLSSAQTDKLPVIKLATEEPPNTHQTLETAGDNR